MGNIYICLKRAYQDLKQENSHHPAFIFIVFALLSIPLIYAANTLSIGLLAVMAIYLMRKNGTLRKDPDLIWPVVLYGLMAISIVWTIDLEVTAEALLKEIPLLVVPLCFMAFPALLTRQKHKILEYYSYGMVLYCLFYLIKAIARFAIVGDSSVFFYHELVSMDVNAIHVSVYVAVAFFFFLSKTNKKRIDFMATGLLFVMIFLLSSKNIILVFSFLLLIYALFYIGISKKMRFAVLGLFAIFIAGMALTDKITGRFRIEYETAMNDATVNDALSKGDAKVYNVSIRQAWKQENFTPADYFPGAALRVFQFRIFTEMLQEDHIFFTGYGLNASYPKIQEKVIEHNLYLGDGENSGYRKNNFHNQYIQNFAELGFFGLLLLIIILWINFKNAVRSKDFTHISFAILMISLFLTESFLWRQRGVTFFIMMYCIFNSALNIAPVKNKPL